MVKNPTPVQQAVDHLKSADPVLAGIIERVGPLRMQYREPVFETLVRSIAFQQLNGKAAATIFGRLRCACLNSSADDSPLTPESILALSEKQMRACGLSRQKLSYIRDLAQRTAAGEINFARLPEMSDEDVIEHLTRVKGIGVWSAHMFLIFALRRPNIMPTLDYGIRAAIKKFYRKRKLPNHKQLMKIAKPWQPYCSVACWYLWRSLDVKT